MCFSQLIPYYVYNGKVINQIMASFHDDNEFQWGTIEVVNHLH